MTHDTRSPEEIERDIERDRAQLTDNLDTLQNKLSIDGLIGQVSNELRDHSSEIGQSLSRTVKDNPAAVALTGIGLAWMIFGNKSTQQPSHDDRSASYRSYSASRGVGHNTSGPASANRSDLGYRGGSAALPSWMDTDQDDDSYVEQLGAAASTARDRVNATAHQASSKLRDAKDAAENKADDIGSKVASGVDDTKEKMSEVADKAQRRAEALRERLSEGTENLSEEARERVVAAREAALDARRNASDALARSSEHAADFYDRQPLIVGALAMAVGAAIGGAAPRTQKEDELMGAHSDRMIAEAERIFEEEREKAAAVVSAATNEAKKVAQEKKSELDSGAPGDKTAGEAVAEEAKSAGKRVAETARETAESKGLGKVNT